MPPEIVTAKASEKPCELYRYHAPKPSRTQGHHRKPLYLQKRVFNEVRDHEIMWLCGTCHDSTHDWLDWLLGEARKPDPEPGRKAKAEAKVSYDWYVATTTGLVMPV